jgi:hypothetical protein
MNGELTALVGALIGAGAAVLSARINTHSLRNQAKNQAIVEHLHWRRQGRFEAYETFVDTVFRALGTLERNRMRASGPGATADLDSLETSARALANASNKVLLDGPELMHEFSMQICGEYRKAKDMLAHIAVPAEADEWRVTAGNLLNLAAIFLLAAPKVLDAPTPEEISYSNEAPPG